MILGYFILEEENTHTVTFDANGGTNAPAKQTKIRGEELTLRSDAPSHDTYIFRGWSTKKGSKIVEYYSGSKFDIDADVTLYAVWDRCAEIGDLNGDGDVDSSDATLLMKYDAGIAALSKTQLAIADLNGDGDVDSADAAIIQKYDAGIIQAI